MSIPLAEQKKNSKAQSIASSRIKEERLRLIEQEVCSYGDTVHYTQNPKMFSRCQGSYLYDMAGKPYLDLQMWYSTVNLGYANPRINDAAKRQIDTLPQLACQYLHQEKIELAQMIAESVKKSFGLKGRVHFNVGGAQAVEDALKLVRKTTGRSRMFAFEGSYHGRTLGASSLTASYRYREAFGSFADRAEFIPYPHAFRSPYPNNPEAAEEYFIHQFERKFEHECTGAWDPKAKRCEFGGFFIEPVQGTGGYIVPPRGYFKRLAKICRDYGILFVDDEVQMGVFRTGKMWALEHFDVQPDILIFAKAITNGLNPLSGIWAREELISPAKFGPGSTHSTYSSNTIGTAAALEVMKVLSEKNYEPIINAKSERFMQRLKALQRKHPEMGHVDGLGLALRVEMCEEDGITPNRDLANKIFAVGMEENLEIDGRSLGLVLNIVGYHKHVIAIAPSLEITDDEIDLACKLLDVAIIRAKNS